MSAFEVRGDFAAEEIGHLIIPGGGRSPDGMELTASGLDRVITAAAFYHEQQWHYTPKRLVIPAGYKTPAEPSAGLVTTRELGYPTLGIPKAILMARALRQRKVRSNQIKPEADSIDTVTNFVYARSLIPYGDNRPVGIVSQSAHLDRILTYIAPRVLSQPAVGIVVPERDPHKPEPDSLFARLFSRWVLRGLQPDTPYLRETATARVERTWRHIQGVRNKLGKAGYPGQLNAETA